MPAITINGNSLEVAAGVPALTAQPTHLGADAAAPSKRVKHQQAADASKSDYILVQTKGPISSHQKVELVNLGLVTHKYVSENACLYGYKKSDLKVIRDLPFVAWADVYPQQFVIAPDLKLGEAPQALSRQVTSDAAEPQTKMPLEVDVIFHRDIDSTADHIKTDVMEKAGSGVEMRASQGKVRLSGISVERLDAIAAIDAVQLIQKVYPVTLHNNVARAIMGAEVWATSTPYRGSGETVCVADTGFDKGSTTDVHPAFTGRVKKLYAFGRPGVTDDRNGHGTHVSGSVLGDGICKDVLDSTLDDKSTATGSKGGRIQGTAPQASLVLQSLLTTSGGLAVPDSLPDLFLPPYLNDHARVHTNSWGTPWQGFQLNYDASSAEIDTFVWQHPDMVICFSAGNDGSDQVLDKNRFVVGGEVADGIIDLGSVGQYASAKNCIAVGASESLRPEMQPNWGNWWPKNFPKDPVAGDRMADKKDGMAAFSSRGPTNKAGAPIQQRFKPDLVAPGSFILSARSRVATENGWGTTSDNLWFWEGGTSMATPLVAGCAAVVRESLVKNGTPNPSAALVKALLINGADELHGQYAVSEAGKSPNNNSGFGLVNLRNAIIDDHRHPHDPQFGTDSSVGCAEGGPLQQGAQQVHAIKAPARGGFNAHPPQGPPHGPPHGPGAHSTTFKVTLVWSDPAGETLQNDLDLVVIASDGKERHGNMSPTSTDFDRVNNVEQVVWNDLPAGDVTVIVKAFRITDGADPDDGPQPYALAWRFS